MKLRTEPSESYVSVRRGKIARLPADIRLQLNLRLEDGLETDQILPWLNNLPQVLQIIQTRFDGIPISPQNLSAWRQGGYQEWLIHRQLFDTAAHVNEQLEEFQAIFNCVNHDQAALKLADGLITQLTIRFTAFMAQWTGGAPDAQTKEMLKIGQFILKLQQSVYRGQRQAAELPAIRYRVKHEVQTDLRNEIHLEMIREKALAADKAEAQRKKSQKKTSTQQPPSTLDKSSPIKPNQASSPPPKESTQSTPPRRAEAFSEGGSTPSIPSTQSTRAHLDTATVPSDFSIPSPREVGIEFPEKIRSLNP